MGKLARRALAPALTFALAVSLKKDVLFFLFAMELAIIALAAAQSAYVRRRAGLHVRLPQRIVFQNEPFEVCAVLENKSRFPIPELTARLAVRFVPETEEQLMVGKLMLGGMERGELCFVLDGTHCGCLELRAESLRLGDMLGIWPGRCRGVRQEKTLLFILPQWLRKKEDIAAESVLPGEQSGLDETVGEDAQTLSEVRAYRPGDRVNRIHWKLSARLGELFTRETGAENGRQVNVLLNLRETGEISVRRTPALWDDFAACVAQVSSSLLDGELAHTVIWLDVGERALVRCAVSDEQSMLDMLCRLLRTEKTSAEMWQEDYLKEIRGNEATIEISIQGDIVGPEQAG